ncbi:MAG: DUF1853 family protein [Gammaproteobacteria bacterium]
MDIPADTYQQRFHARWGHLTQPHVRALAWLLDAPDLLDPDDPHWEGRIASVGAMSPDVVAWLDALDADPSALLTALGERSYTRLGLYAEKLMAFYYQSQGMLVAHGVQVRAARDNTVGEFDFLLDAGPEGVEHIEFATKLYLLEGEAAARFDTFVGPNLADSLGLKMRKIFQRQLTLGQHPAAQPLLPRPVVRARALVKGWLFYPLGTEQVIGGISPRHCRGFWCALSELDRLAGTRFVVLPRLEWLAPYRSGDRDAAIDGAELAVRLAAQFDQALMPVLVAAVREQDGVLAECWRGFVVPDDWRARAAVRRKIFSAPDADAPS